MRKVTKAVKLIAIAEKNLTGPMRSSAEMALSDARVCLVKGWPEYARERALTSLLYSVGLLSPIYQEAYAL